MMEPFHQTNDIATLPTAMAVKYLLAAIHIKRGPAVEVQGTSSVDLVAVAISGGFPALVFEVRKQREFPPQAASLCAGHVELGSGIRVRRAAFQSQANRVGRGRNRQITFSQRPISRRWNQRRTVDGSALRSGSALSGIHASTECACW